MLPFKTIVLIDDDPISNALNKILLQDLGLAEKIMMIPSSVKALKFLTTETNNPDMKPMLILLDINMPVYNGFELLDKAQEEGFDCKEVTILILSSSDDIKDTQKAKEYQLKGYLVKPLIVQSLFEALNA